MACYGDSFMWVCVLLPLLSSKVTCGQEVKDQLPTPTGNAMRALQMAEWEQAEQR
jgi:hypothetical protein